MWDAGTALVLTLLVGLSLGLLGSGGSVVMLPVLVYVAGIEPELAVGMSLAIVGGTSAVATIVRHRQGHVDRRATMLFSLSGMAGAFWGAGLTHLVGRHVLLALFAGLMMAVAVAMLRERDRVRVARQCRPGRCIAVGATVGVLTGFLGVGGGFLLVPALVLLSGIETRRAMGTSLAIISLNAASGLIGHAHHVGVEWRSTVLFLFVALVGMGLGVAVSSNLGERTLTRVFAWSVLAVGVAIAATETYSLYASR